MARITTIGNGNLLVGIDHHGYVRDFYYPYVGHTNHVSGASGSYMHRVGVWVEGTLRWLDHDSWHIDIIPSPHGTFDTIIAINDGLGVTLTMKDVVHNENDIFFREVVVTNNSSSQRLIKVFFAQEFRISESRRGDTAFYDPRVKSILHYKGKKSFLIHAQIGKTPFDDYSVGLFGIENREGTYTDAEDGQLSKNPIEHGSTDSVLGLSAEYAGGASATIHYWIAAGSSVPAVHSLHAHILAETPERLIASVCNYWEAWLGQDECNLYPLKESLQYLYHRSAIVIRVHTDNRGGIIASSDTDLLNQGRDTYGYVWPRDAAISAHALDRAGYSDIAKRFFAYIAKLIEKDGYLMHKYRVDGALGSSWHPWVRDGVIELPIQEDETATTLCMLARHYELARDLEFIESLYNPFIEPAADFLCGYIEHETGLPGGSYDLWEEKFGTSTYTTASVYGALHAAAQLSALLGKRENATKYRARAESIKRALLTYLFDLESGAFVKLVRHEGRKLVYDKTIDISSLHGILYYGVLDASDQRVKSMVRVVEERLKVPTSFGGYMRYEGDNYYRTGADAPPNAWCITTLWMAQYHIQKARTKTELKPAYDILEWIGDRTTKSGILPEQIHPYTGAHLSTSPLVWSHAEYLITVDAYTKKYRALK